MRMAKKSSSEAPKKRRTKGPQKGDSVYYLTNQKKSRRDGTRIVPYFFPKKYKVIQAGGALQTALDGSRGNPLCRLGDGNIVAIKSPLLVFPADLEEALSICITLNLQNAHVENRQIKHHEEQKEIIDKVIRRQVIRRQLVSRNRSKGN